MKEIVLENQRLRVAVLPEAGGRIESFVDKCSGRDWIWRNARLKPQAHPLFTSYDDVWAGGIEELFPNDLEQKIGSYRLPDHGELWSQPWRLLETDGSRLTLSIRTQVYPCTVQKRLILQESCLTISYTLENIGNESLPYLFKLHPAFAVTSTDILWLPGGEFSRVDSQFSTMIRQDGWFRWPGEEQIDQCRGPASQLREFVYVRNLPEGLCGVKDPTTGRSVRIRFPIDVLPYCWVFMTYGGWRGHQVVVLEPCTTYPKDLNEAIRRRSTPFLEPGGVRKFDVRFDVGAAE
ncbi:MAG TPA: DUF5107 domain-containing protein [Bdellovibrionota bacterium]|nr:DUF5107 domain-containing protein [Bdellovibrionota bacterium]